MTDGFDQALANVGLALLRADLGPPALIVFDGKVPDPTPAPPYVLVYTTVEWPDGAPGDSLDGLSGSPVARWTCHCVGGNEIAARAVAQRVRTQLLNQRPTIAGLNLGLIKQEQAAPPTRDETTGSLVMDAVCVYRLGATT
jgi:hypothetical protein